MMPSVKLLFSVAIFAVSLCALPVGAQLGDSKFSPSDIIQRSTYRVDLVRLIDPSKKSPEGTASEDPYLELLDSVLHNFYATVTDPNERNRRRNQIQDRLIWASNELCEDYKSRLKQKHARFNFFSGSGATLLGAAGSLIGHAATARVFSGLAATVTGIRAEYNQDYYADSAAHLITKAIGIRRSRMLSEFESKRVKPVAEYSLERSIADAINYHGACSLIGALEEADSAIAIVDIFSGVRTFANYEAKLKEKPEAANPTAPNTQPNAPANQ
jgi:hypothetical protein